MFSDKSMRNMAVWLLSEKSKTEGDLLLEIRKSTSFLNLLIPSCFFKFYCKHNKNSILIQNTYTFIGKYLVKVIKVARVFKLKLAFMEWFFHNLVILIKLYKIRYLNLDKALLFPRKKAKCLNTESLTSCNCHKV